MSAPSQRSPGTRAGFVLATWFGCGLVPHAPGTVGTLGALPLYYLVAGGGPVAVLGAAYLGRSVGGLLRAGRVAEHRPGAFLELARAMRTDVEPESSMGF